MKFLIGGILVSAIAGVTAVAMGHPYLGELISNGGTVLTMTCACAWIWLKVRR